MVRICVPVVALVLLALSLAPAGGSAHAGAHPLEAVCDSLQERAGASGAQVGMVIIALGDDARCSVNAGETFRTASLYKLIVLAEAYAQSASGEFSFDETMTLEVRHYVDDPPQLRPSGPVQLTAREAIRRMIVVSDNGAATALRERLGHGRVAATPQRLGLPDTSLAGQFVTTPSDIARFFSALYRGELVSPEASEQMLQLLRAQQLNDLIPASLPAGTEVAHKTGLIEQYLHDAGIVSAPGGDYVLVLLTRWDTAIEQSYLAIHDLTALSYTAFETPLPVAPPPQPSVVEAALGEPGTVDRALARPVEEPVLMAADEPPARLAVGRGSPSVWWRRPAPLLAALAAAALVGLIVSLSWRRLATVRRASPPEGPAGGGPRLSATQNAAVEPGSAGGTSQLSSDHSHPGAVPDASRSADGRLGAASPAGPRALPSVSEPPQSEDEDAAGQAGASA